MICRLKQPRLVARTTRGKKIVGKTNISSHFYNRLIHHANCFFVFNNSPYVDFWPICIPKPVYNTPASSVRQKKRSSASVTAVFEE